MPLSEPAPREALHHREIVCRGYRRSDGLWDIEAHLTDTKTYTFSNANRGDIAPGEPLHDMWLRLTIDGDFVIQDAEAATDAGPFALCPAITPRFAGLKGIAIRPGWMRKVRKLLGGVNGCTHLVELLRPVATVAYQTIWTARGRGADAAERRRKPIYLDSCHALRSDGEVVREHYPEWYSGEAVESGD
ncbi:MAG: DUF2889 domain-containing protein [Alphaproteobacteria bacterium]